MAKKKKNKGAQDIAEMSKSELKVYHKEICEFFLDHGWKQTLSNFSLSPKQGSAIISEKVRAKRKLIEKESKKAEAAKAKAARKKAPKKVKAPKKAANKAKNPAKRASKKVAAPSNIDDALDFLLAYRSNSGPVTLDEAIIELTLQSRAA